MQHKFLFMQMKMPCAVAKESLTHKALAKHYISIVGQSRLSRIDCLQLDHKKKGQGC